MCRMVKYKCMHELRELLILSLLQRKCLRRTQDSSLSVSSYIQIDLNHSRTQCTTQIAEVIGTVSAIVQLATALNLLGQLCKDAKDIRQIIEDARSDLTRLSILLKQLIPHAKHINDDARLLALNISNCAKRAIRVQDLVEKMERCIECAPLIGRLYTIFISVELKQLLDELERAKEEMRGALRPTITTGACRCASAGLWGCGA
jgi:hypothetical protein